MDENILLGIQRFLLWPSYYDQEKVNLFLDACRKIFRLSQQQNFGLPQHKSIGADEVVHYYLTVIMPQLQSFLAKSFWSEIRLDRAAIHVTSLASAISRDITQVRWSNENLNKVNGLMQICMILAQEICQKKDDDDRYYQFTELYRESVQRYANVIPPDQLLLDSIAARAAGVFSPSERVSDNAMSAAECALSHGVRR